MRKNIITTILIIITAFCSFAVKAQSPTAPAQGFNVFVKNGATFTTSECEGPVALGGNLTLAGNYNFASHNNFVYQVSGVNIALLVGGRIYYNSGNQYQVLNSGYVKIGDSTGSKVWYNYQGNNIHITPNTSSSNTSNPDIELNTTASNLGVSSTSNPVFQSGLIDFTAAFNTMQSSASSLAACTDNMTIYNSPNGGSTAISHSGISSNTQIYTTLTSSAKTVLNISGSDLNNITSFTFQNPNGSTQAPDASHIWVINVNASGTFTWSTPNGLNGSYAPYIIWNFYNTTTLNISGNNTIEGTVFAPYADINKSNNNSNIEGQVIGLSYSQTASGEIHSYNMTSTVAGCGTPTAAGFTINTATQCLSGNSFAFTNSSTGSSLTYSWNFGDGSALNTTTSPTHTYTTAGTYTVKLVTTGANGTDSATHSVTLTASVTPSVNVSANPGTTICSGTSTTFTATPTNGGSTPSYQWKKNGTNVGTNSTTYTDASLNNNDIITCVLTSNATCASPTTATSSNTTMTVNNNVTPSVSVSANPGTTICSGTSTTFTATPTNGGSTPSYQWKKNGTNVGSNSTTYTDASLSNNDIITCILTSNATCASPTTATSSNTTMTVNSNVTPSVSVSANPGTTICSGTSTTFTATPTNGGSTPSYQWKKNGTNVGTNSTTYTDASLSNNDIITCVLTSNATCASPTSATSSNTTMTVNSNVTPSVSISANPGTIICSGTSTTFTATPTNGGSTPSYQWKKNGTNVGTNSTTYTDASLNNNDIITCVLTSNATCASPTTATSSNTTMTVNSNVTPSVSVSANPGTSICSGTSTTFTATQTNGGSTPSYQWKKNGTNVGTNNTTYTDASLSNNDIITCILTSNATCASPTSATSSNTTMTVNSNVTPSVSVSANPGTTICSGTSTTFTATPTNGGSTPSYQWKKNGTNVGTNSTTYTDASLSNNDIITCVLTNNATCASPTSATSSNTTMTVTPTATPSVSISGNSSICTGTSVTFTATPTNGGTPSYQWKKNGSSVGLNSNTYTDNGLNNSDVITVVMTGNAACTNNTPVTSNAITMSVNGTATQPGAYTTSSSVVFDGQTNVTYTVPAVSGTTYTWSYTGSGATITGSGNSVTLSFNATATSGTLNVTATTVACGTPSIPQSIAVTVKPYETWTCGSNNDWNTPANWDGGFVPYSTISVLIPSGTPCQPNVCTGSASVNNMTVQSGATVNICCPNIVSVNGDLTLNGSVLGCGTLVIPGTTCHTIYGNGRVDNFELNNSCGGIINTGDTLHIGDTYKPTLGVMTVNGELELLSDSTATAEILTHPGTCATYIVGDVICDKYIHGGRRAFRFFGHPFSTSIPLSQLEPYVDITGQGGAANGFTPTVNNEPSAFWYNTLTGNGSTTNDSTGWIPFTSTNGAGANAWNQYEGLRLFVRGRKGQGLGCDICVPEPITIKMHGSVNECDQTVTLAVNSNVGFNFISNPYPADIDLSQSTRGNAIGANFNVWDPNQGLVGAYVEQPFSLSYVLPAYSSFFTTCNSNTGKSITFHETDKTSAAPTGDLFKTTGANNMIQLRILSNNDSLSWDRLLLIFNDQSLAGTDQLDGTKLLNPDLSFYTFSGDNDILGVDQRPYVNGQVIKLGIITDVNQAYSIRVDNYDLPAGAVVYLHDKYLGQVQQLSQGMHYNFTVSSDAASQGDNRFELNVTGTTGVANVSATTSMRVDMFPNPVTDNATISYDAPQIGNTTVIVANVMGQQVYTDQLGETKSGKVTLPLNGLVSGIYMVTFKCGDLTVTKRLIKQ